MIDLHDLLSRAAPVPTHALDFEAVLARANRHRWSARWRRLVIWLTAGAAVVGGLAVPVSNLLAPAQRGGTHLTTVHPPGRVDLNAARTPSPASAAGPGIGRASSGRGPATGATGAPGASSTGSGGAGAIAVACPTANLQTAIDRAAPGSTLHVSGTCAGNFTITKNLTLVGPATLDGASTGSALAVSGHANVSLSSLTFQHGSGNTATNPQAGGGGIYNADGTLTLVRSTVSNNTGTNGAGIYNGGTLTLESSTVSGNSTVSQNAGVNGGGIYNAGTLTLKDSTVSGNSSVGHGDVLFAPDGVGGGIFNRGPCCDQYGGLIPAGTVTLVNSTVTGNTAEGDGGGLYNGGTLTLTDSTVTNNTTDPAYHGGGIYNEPGYYPPSGRDVPTGTVTNNNSTISGNKPDDCYSC
jgi:hypothetical protein